jgi:hypothetical protein
VRFAARPIALALGAALVLLATIARRDALGEAIETATFSTVLSMVGGLAVGGCLLLAMNRRRPRAG